VDKCGCITKFGGKQVLGRYVCAFNHARREGHRRKIAHVKSMGLTFVFNFEKLNLPFMHIDLFLY
jgi:hypothetical protein